MKTAPFSARWKLLRRLVQLLVIFMLVSPALGYSFFSGTLISGELFGLSLTDPLAAIDHTLATRSIVPGILIGAFIVVVFYRSDDFFVFALAPVYRISASLLEKADA